jgi:propionyl-CoA synthetase
VLDDSNKPFYRWFTGGMVNTCYNALDYHVENGRGDQAALIYDSPVTDTIKTYTYRELRDEVPHLPACWPARVWSRATGSSFTCP